MIKGSLLSLPDEVILLIAEYMGIWCDNDEYRPNAFRLFATAKRFAFLADYRYSFVVRGEEYSHCVTTINLHGDFDGPSWDVFQGRLDGWRYWINDRIVGDHCCMAMLASNHMVYQVNSKLYDSYDDDFESDSYADDFCGFMGAIHDKIEQDMMSIDSGYICAKMLEDYGCIYGVDDCAIIELPMIAARHTGQLTAIYYQRHTMTIQLPTLTEQPCGKVPDHRARSARKRYLSDNYNPI